MTPSGPALPGAIAQHAYVVTDLDDAMAWWCAQGVGPWFVLHELRQQGYVHRGEAVEPVLTLAFANSGELQVELVVAHDDTPSPFRDFLETGRSGAHHLAWWTPAWDEWSGAAEAAGWAPVSHGDGGGMARWAYHDRGGPLLVEVMELNDATRWLASTVRDAHLTWDGVSDPVRSLL